MGVFFLQCSREKREDSFPNTVQVLCIPGLMTVVGKMIPHSIVRCGVGFPFLSPVCYWYLITGDVSEAISYGNIEDVRDIEYAELIHRVIV